MQSKFTSDPRPSDSQRLTLSVARRFFVVGALLSLVGATAIALQDLHLTPTNSIGLVTACGVMAALFGLAGWKAHALAPKTAVLATSWLACALVTGVAAASGFSVQSHALGYFSLLACFVAVFAGVRHAIVLAGYGALVIGALAAADSAGLLHGASRVAAAPLSDPVISQLMLLAGGLGVGLIVARVAADSLRAHGEREERFACLLRMATDRYWELDAELRFVRAATTSGAPLALSPESRFGLRPWETPDYLGVPESLREAHKEDLLARRPFSGLRTCVSTEPGRPRHFDVSGQPRFDAQGEFLGYWGTSRDITDEVNAERALRQSQTMLSLLFANSPDCITLSELESGKVKMVNGGFTRLTGYGADEVVGRSTIELGIWHAPAERELFVATLRGHGRVNEQRCVFVTKSGARVAMQVSASRCMIDDEECVVINARDVTESERTRLEYAAILERASIGIAVTRDRVFATANPCFERMFGWDKGSLAGQSGRVVWPTDTDYAEIGRIAGPLLAIGEPVDMEREMRRKDGRVFWCRLLARALDPCDALGSGTIWIAEDVTERRASEQALAAARDAAEAASRAKSAFLANTSHEIRTPLNGLLGMARLAAQAGVDPTRRQQYLGHILDSAQSLASIISDILDLSKVEAGRIDLERVSFGLPDLLRSMCQAYQSLAEAKGLTLTLVLDPQLPAHVCGDPLRVRQILSNFVSNALKFTPSGQVRIEAHRRAGEGVRLAVVDTGPGIPDEVQQRLFRPFSQADESTTRRFGGSGLGLSICRELARLMGGEVGLASAPGAGSTFWAELPLPAAQEGEAPHDTEARDVALLRGKRVLIAEDNPVNMLITAALLEQWGVAVTQAHDGVLAVEAVRCASRDGAPFDMVLMDMHMPQMGGLAAARLLRQEFGADALPILALTAAALASERDEALQSGMCDFLTKPIDATHMRQTLVRHLVRHPVRPLGHAAVGARPPLPA